MTSRLALIGVFALLVGSACDRPDRGYYWWDQTNSVWCYTYSSGDTQCDTPSEHSHNGGDPGGDPDTNGGDTVTGGDVIPGDDDTSQNNDTTLGDGDDVNGDNDTSGGDIDTGIGGDNDSDVTTPPTVCQDIGDGKRYCVVTDGDHICEFVYDANGNITGACAQTGINTVDHHGCSQSNQGGLICEFETDAGDQCIVVFDMTGVVEFDPCHYFQSPTG